MKKEIIMFVSLLIFAFIFCGAVSAVNVGSHSMVTGVHYKDLVVSSINAPAKGFKGYKISVINTVKNQGNTKISNTFKTNFYLTSTKKLSGSKTYIGSRYISSLLARGYNKKVTSFKIPNKIVSGSYYILAVTDSTNKVNELNEKNNYRFSSTRINIKTAPSNNGLPDLTITEIKHVDKDFFIQFTVKNKGTKASGPCKAYVFMTYLTISMYPSYHIQFIPWPGILNVPGLAPGKTYTGKWTTNWNVDSADVTIDYYNQIKESNEKNNKAKLYGNKMII